MIPSEKTDKRSRIIEAATIIFANDGFDNAKIKHIAQKAKVADGTIYLYFKSKDDILICIFEEAMSRVIEIQTNSVFPLRSASERLLLFAENHAKMVISKVDLAALIQLEIRQSSKFMKDYKNKQFANYLQLISNIITYGQSRGEFLSVINENLAKHSFFGAIDEISTQWLLLAPKHFNLQKSVKEFTKIFLRGISS